MCGECDKELTCTDNLHFDIFHFSPFKKGFEEKGFAKYDELDEVYGEVDEEEIRDDRPTGNCPKWCARCPFDNVCICL